MQPNRNPQKLVEDIRLVMNTIIALHNEEIEAVIKGDVTKLPKIKAQLAEARNEKDLLLESFKAAQSPIAARAVAGA